MRPAVALTAVFLVLAGLSLAFGLPAAPSQAQRGSLLYPRPARLSSLSLAGLERWQTAALSHYRGAYRAHERVADRRALTRREWTHRRWFRKASEWTARELAETREKLRPPAPNVDYWAGVQIHYATLIAQSALRDPRRRDPWPNCPDPYFNGATWADTVACENHGNWLDSPGYYRCGLQFDPMWEAHYGRRFCP